MENILFRPAKLLVTIVGKYSGELVVEATKRGGARGGTKAAGRGMAEFFSGCADCTEGGHASEAVTEALVFTLMYDDEADSVVQAVIRAGLEDPEHLNGMAFVLDAGAMVRPGSGAEIAQDALERAGSERMVSGNTLITSIITHGQADEIMRVARAAGARGGTILNARGTGTEDDVQFFGISLAPEKEMLLIMAASAQAGDILEAICRLPIFSEPGGGIVYTTPVEEFFMLGS